MNLLSINESINTHRMKQSNRLIDAYVPAG